MELNLAEVVRFNNYNYLLLYCPGSLLEKYLQLEQEQVISAILMYMANASVST